MGLSIKQLDDKELVSNIQAGTEVEKSLIELVDRHSGIYFSMVQRYSKNSNKLNMDMEHLMGSCEFTIFEAAKNYNPKKATKFSSFLGLWSRWSVLNHIKHSSKLLPCEEVFVEDEEAPAEIPSDMSITQVLEIIQENYDERIYKLFRLRYIDAEGNKVSPWREVSKHIPSSRDPSRTITIQACISLHDKTLNKIRHGLKLK